MDVLRDRERNVVQQDFFEVGKKKQKEQKTIYLRVQFHPDLNTESIQTLSVRLRNTDSMANNTLTRTIFSIS